MISGEEFDSNSEPLRRMKIEIFKKLIIDTLYDYIEKHNILKLHEPRGLEQERKWINEDTINKIINEYKNGELLPRKRD